MDDAPVLVAELARQVNGTPLAWNIQPSAVTIVMVDGRKIVFDRVPETETGSERQPATGAEEPPRPAVSQSPNGSMPKPKKGAKHDAKRPEIP